MRRTRFSSRKTPQRKIADRPVEELVRELKQAGMTDSSYREQSLRIHGLICAKCGREFESRDRHLLTVHHKDGNSRNNPPDGSNWENLCVYCHENEHSRAMLADYLDSRNRRTT